jgi:hypothetical protein
MSTALQAFQYKRKLNKAIKDVQAPFMGKNKSSAKQESSSWINSITGKKHDDAKREVDVKQQDSKQKSFLPWHRQNVEEEGPQASPDKDQPESSKLVAVKDDGMKPERGDDEGLLKETKSPKALFKRRNRHVSDNGEETNKESPSPSNNDETKSTTMKKEKKKDNDDDWWMDDNDSESENDANESSHHKKVVHDEDEPEYNPRAEAEYAKANGGGSSWWE